MTVIAYSSQYQRARVCVWWGGGVRDHFFGAMNELSELCGSFLCVLKHFPATFIETIRKCIVHLPYSFVAQHADAKPMEH